MFQSSFREYARLSGELDADSFAVRYGYGVELNSLLSKLTSERGTVAILSSRNPKEEKAIMQWSIKNVMEFSLRRGEILSQLQRQLREEPSEYLRSIIQSQIDTIKKTKTVINISGITSNESQLIEESLKSFVELHQKGLSYLELDEIEVEMQRMTDHEDKMYLITRIYRDLNILDKAVAKKEEMAKKKASYSKNYQDNTLKEYEDFRKSLLDLLKKIKAVKIKEKDYTIRVEYPDEI